MATNIYDVLKAAVIAFAIVAAGQSAVDVAHEMKNSDGCVTLRNRLDEVYGMAHATHQGINGLNAQINQVRITRK